MGLFPQGGHCHRELSDFGPLPPFYTHFSVGVEGSLRSDKVCPATRAHATLSTAAVTDEVLIARGGFRWPRWPVTAGRTRGEGPGCVTAAAATYSGD